MLLRYKKYLLHLNTKIKNWSGLVSSPLFCSKLAILDSNGSEVVQYNYNAWGEHTVSGSQADTIGAKNPFRYRSYFYDAETQLYYLKTRYYDPAIGRFINMDSVQYADPENINGLNLYAYCGNNPVMNMDPDGHSFIVALLIGMAIGAAIGGTMSGVSAYKEGRRGLELFASILGGVTVGSAMGAVMVLGGAAGLAYTGATVAGFGMSAGVAFGASVGIGAMSSVYSYLLINGIHSDKKITLEGIGLSAAKGVVDGAVTFGVGFFGGKNGLFNKLGNFNTMDAFYLNMISNTGKIGLIPSLFYGTSMLMGETLSRALCLSLPAAGIRVAIDWLFSLFA